MIRLIARVLVFFALIAPVRAAHGTIEIRDAWSRPAFSLAVVYLTVQNDGDRADALIGAATPLASHADIHESREQHVAGSDTIVMQAVSAIPIAAKGRTSLKPGGYHLMLSLRHDVHAGETFPLRLHFRDAGWITTTVIVRSMRSPST